ncbi:sterol desaturase family protein [Candidatus Saccharibacteria bacterium]|nr:sterol desaturase family protein [Candidatus Saccharibacteria bacterium]
MTILLQIISFTFIGPLFVEVGGYFWHRFAEHQGWLGESVRARHIVHHQEDYPVEALRPAKQKYQSANSWSWYVLALILMALAYVLFPPKYSLLMIAGGLLYATFVVSKFHKSFHLQRTWLQRFAWYKKLVKLHDIHHYAPVNYGINFFFMDRLFGTYQETQPQKALPTFTKPKHA